MTTGQPAPLDLDEIERNARSGWRPDRPTTLRLTAALRVAREEAAQGWQVVQTARGYPFIIELADAVDRYDQATSELAKALAVFDQASGAASP